MHKIFKRNPETGRIIGLTETKGIYTMVFLVVGFLSLVWFLVRVIPKPSRVRYPCMKATMPIAWSFIAYLASLAASVVFFRKAYEKLRKRQFIHVFIIVLLGGLSATWALVNNNSFAGANPSDFQPFHDSLGPNVPIGEAIGIHPGRVVWAWDPDATNENCTNSSHSDAYWVSTNTNQEVVDQMLSDALRSLTGEESDSAAWDAVFRYFNQEHGKGDVGYDPSETIFIKINAVTAWSGAAPFGEMPSNLGIEYDTSPQTIMAMLRQLIYNAGVPQENIFIGDPMADIWNTIYDYLYAEFPDVNYVSKRTIPGRYKLTASNETGITFSDKGTVMTEVTSYKFFQEFMDAEYLLNIPSMKGHRWGGVTFFAKNHFGSHTVDHSWEMHKGLMNPDESGMRYGYNLYRVFVDLIGSSNLGGKTLIYFMDGLWSTSYEHQKPQKFISAPFNNDWSSSILLSQDPVAIESVCLDIMQKEFTVESEEIIDGYNGPAVDRFIYVQWDGVDDYLHQAASSDWWPEGIEYDPDNSGSPIGSQGVHEHWNNTTDMEYSRNLESGEGIELVKLFYGDFNLVSTLQYTTDMSLFPNPCNNRATLNFTLGTASEVSMDLYGMKGNLVKHIAADHYFMGNKEIGIDLGGIQPGVYFCVLEVTNSNGTSRFTRKLIKR